MNKEDIVKYLTEKGYPVSTGGDIPTFEEAIKEAMELYDYFIKNYKEDQWMKKAVKWMREEFYTSKDRDGHNILISASWGNVEELIKDFKKQTEE